MKEVINKINKLKKEKNAIVLAHCYQNIEIDEVADYVGDSLYLSRCAAKTDAEIIVFAGVYFMAETAKILSPDKKVLLPNINAGCAMADMINLAQIQDFKAKNPNVPVVCYINSSASVKSEADIICTSANAVEIVKSLNAKRVLFVPDKFLGGHVASCLPDVEIICYDGFCPVHARISPDDIFHKKKKYPDAKVLIHPECAKNVLELADFIGSTSAIMKYAKESTDKQFIIVTEQGVTDRLRRDLEGKEFIGVSKNAICESMKLNTLDDILNSLENETHEIDVDPEISKKALGSILKMIGKI